MSEATTQTPAAPLPGPTRIHAPRGLESTMERILAAPVDRVFAAHTDPEQVVRWWGPAFLTTRVDRLEAEKGGSWRFVQRDRDGTEHAFHGTFLDVVPGKRIQWTFVYEPFPDSVLEETLEFEDLGDGRTLLRATSRFPDEETLHQMASSGMEEGGRETWQRLADHVERQDVPHLRLERTFDAPRQRVWDAWADPEQYAKWLNPMGADLVVHEWDFRPGGTARFTMPLGDGQENNESGVFHVIDEPFELVQGSPDGSFLIRTSFHPDGDGTRTRMVVDCVGVPPEYHGAAREGWGKSLDKLEGVVRHRLATSGRPEETIISRTIEAPPERVWQALTDADTIGDWWGPEGFTTTTRSMDVRVGGHWDNTMRGPDGTEYPNCSTYLEIDPPRRLVYDHGERAGEEPWFRSTIELEPVADGTRVTLRSTFPSQKARDDVIASYGAIEGGYQTLGRLAEHVESAR